LLGFVLASDDHKELFYTYTHVYNPWTGFSLESRTRTWDWISTATHDLNMGLDCLIWDGTQARSHSVTMLELVEASFLKFIVVTYGSYIFNTWLQP